MKNPVHVTSVLCIFLSPVFISDGVTFYLAMTLSYSIIGIDLETNPNPESLLETPLYDAPVSSEETSSSDDMNNEHDASTEENFNVTKKVSQRQYGRARTTFAALPLINGNGDIVMDKVEVDDGTGDPLLQSSSHSEDQSETEHASETLLEHVSNQQMSYLCFDVCS